ncbi:MAG TPA: class I SAM-dependent methyltransferase [Candidatus Saccharimonadales bacterium]|nr:class I SAM-dependent methyltransferase [Candidatus Saccharimonadales bacterium]
MPKRDRVNSVGRVKLAYLSDEPNASYADDAEDQLLELFMSDDANKQRFEILSNNPPWSLYYHLSPQRGNIIGWYEFEPDVKVLEVGAGCGAITEELLRQDVDLTALELTEKRSLINAYRNQGSALNVVVGNLEDYQPAELFDYVVCVGVLEYAGSFITDKGDPYVEFLKLLKRCLKPSGKIILAIENRLGLKYWAGAREDHTGKFFEGLNGYPGDKAVQTFGKAELGSLFGAAGFSEQDFYYPFPDYKLPLLIYSDQYLPGRDCEFPLGLLPVQQRDASRHQLFSEQMAMLSLEKNQLFDQFANSFLVVAK